MFEINTKVVCIDDQNFLACHLMEEFPKKGNVYLGLAHPSGATPQ